MMMFLIAYGLGTAYFAVSMWFLLKHAASEQYFKALISGSAISFAIIIGLFPILNILFALLLTYFLRYLYAQQRSSDRSASIESAQ